MDVKTKNWKERYVPTAGELYFSTPPADAKRRMELEANFFCSLRLKNGIYKLTYPQRLDDLNDLVSGLLPSTRPLQIMDVAVSSGVSTLEWIENLRRVGIAHQMTAGDLVINAFLVSIGRHLRLLTDGEDYPLQFDILGKAISNPPGRRNLTLYFPFFLLAGIGLRLHAAGQSHGVQAGNRPTKRYGIDRQPVSLVSPMLKEQPNVEIVEDDILTPNVRWQHRFDVLRAANILHRGYFNDDTLVRIVSNLRSRLKHHGRLIICRTNKSGDNHATIFALNEACRFEALARLGNGSEIDDLVLGLD